MEPIEHTNEPEEMGQGWKRVTWAKNQPVYKPLPAFVSPWGLSVSRWTFTDEERAAIARGEDLYLHVLTFGGPLQPVNLSIGEINIALGKPEERC